MSYDVKFVLKSIAVVFKRISCCLWFSADFKHPHCGLNMYGFSSHQVTVYYSEIIFFHLFKFMTKFTFKHCLSFGLLIKTVKKFCGKFSCLVFKSFFIFQIFETSKKSFFNSHAFTCINYTSTYGK